MAHRTLPKRMLQRLPAAWQAELEHLTAEPVVRGMSGAKLWRLHTAPQQYLKLAQGAGAAPLREEIARTRWLGDQGICVPRIARVHASAGSTALLTYAVNGIPADEIHWPVERVLMAIGRGLARLHALPLSDCPFDEGLSVRLGRARAAVERGTVDPAQFASRNRRIAPDKLLARLAGLREPAPDLVVAHGDATLSNLLVGPDETLAFVDCGHLGRADRYLDLAVLCAEAVAHFGENARRVLTRAYGLRRWNAAKAAYYADLYEFF